VEPRNLPLAQLSGRLTLPKTLSARYPQDRKRCPFSEARSIFQNRIFPHGPFIHRRPFKKSPVRYEPRK
jgi:hypothetical protein